MDDTSYITNKQSGKSQSLHAKEATTPAKNMKHHVTYGGQSGSSLSRDVFNFGDRGFLDIQWVLLAVALGTASQASDDGWALKYICNLFQRMTFRLREEQINDDRVDEE